MDMKPPTSSNWSRRRLLRTAFCSSTLLGLNVGRGLVNAAEAGAGDDLHWLAIGDFGSMEPAQTAVANGMKKYVADLRLKTEGLLLLGDNFYKPMPGGLKAARWKAGFEEMYPASSFPGPCLAVLGNHDYHDNKGGEQVQLAYAKQGGTRWTMPAKWYRMDFPLVTFLFIDTNLRAVSGTKDPKTDKVKASLTEQEEKKQMAWLKGELAKPRAPWTICVGHHPVYSNGQHGDTEALVSDLAPLLQAHGVQTYLCGHDHDMQHLELEGQKTSFVISGGGGARVRPMKNDKRGPFSQSVHGFTHIQTGKERLAVRHIDPNGTQLHAFEKHLDGSFKITG
jgi:tartrate-resistant acid phosphatase type 5